MIVKKLPEIDFKVGDIEIAINKIKEFYKELGWDEAISELNPTKIKVNRKDYLKMGDDFKSNGTNNDEKMGLSMIWMNYGPSVDDTVKEGTVRVYKDFFTLDKV